MATQLRKLLSFLDCRHCVVLSRVQLLICDIQNKRFKTFFFSLNRYGLPFVSPNNILVSTINGTGAAIESVYVLLYIIFAPKREKAKILGLLTLVLTVFGAVALVSLLALQGKPRKLFCGLAATIFSIIMYASPLSIMVRFPE